MNGTKGGIMRKIYFIFLVFLVISMCYPLHVQTRNLSYASDYYVHGNDLVNKGQYEEALKRTRLHVQWMNAFTTNTTE